VRLACDRAGGPVTSVELGPVLGSLDVLYYDLPRWGAGGAGIIVADRRDLGHASWQVRSVSAPVAPVGGARSAL